MNDMPKARPGGSPHDAMTLATKLGPADRAPEDPTNFRIRLDIEGGTVHDRYEFHFDATGAGDVQSMVANRLRDIDVRRQVGHVPQRDIVKVLKSIDIADFDDVRRRLPPIPPDSTVGILTVSDGTEEAAIIFMADDGQAESAGFELPPRLRQAIDEIYDVAATQLGQPSVRP